MDNQRLMSTDDAQGATKELLRILTIMKRALLNWKPSIVIVSFGVLLGAVIAVVKAPTFQSETIVIYRQGVRIQQEAGGVSLSLGVRLQEMLLARSRLEAIIEELNLYQREKQREGAVEAVEAFRKDITFKARSTDTFSISFKGNDPKVVQRVTERLAQSLMDENQKLRIEQARIQREFLEAEKLRAETELKEKERQLASFLAEHPEFALDANSQAQGGASIRAQAMADRATAAGDPALRALERQASRNRALLDPNTAVPRPEANADPALEATLSQAQSELATARSDLAGKKSRFTDQHPDVVAASARVAELESKVKAAEQKVRDSRVTAAADLDSKFNPEQAKEKLKGQLKSVEAEIALRKKATDDKEKGKQADAGPTEQANRIVALETDWARLSRDVSEARERMNELERNYFRAQIEASSSLGGYSDQVVVLDPAYLPSKPNPPGKTLIVIIAFGVAFVLAMIIAVLRALLDNRVYEEADLSRVAPVLAVVPRAGSRRWWRR